MGDGIASLAVANGWKGIVINGYVRDSAIIKSMTLGVLARGTMPVKSLKDDPGEIDVPVAFAGIRFVPGHYIYADEDGLIVSDTKLD